MGKPMIGYSNVPDFKEWLTNFKLLFQASSALMAGTKAGEVVIVHILCSISTLC